MQALLERAAQRNEALRRHGRVAWPTAEVVQIELQTRVAAMTALQRLIISARAAGTRLLNLRWTAGQRLAEAEAWAAQLDSDEAMDADECCRNWHVTSGT